MQIGAIFQIATLLDLPDFHQQATKSITLLGITQDKPNQVKRAFHKAKSQWSRMWSTDSSFLLHKQHLFTIITRIFLRLSTIRILPKAAVQAKKKPPSKEPESATPSNLLFKVRALHNQICRLHYGNQMVFKIMDGVQLLKKIMMASWRGQRGNRLLVLIWIISSLCLMWCL
jgi:hypothetical protein